MKKSDYTCFVSTILSIFITFSTFADNKQDTKTPFTMVKASNEQKIGAAHFEIDEDSKSLIVTTDSNTNEIIKNILMQLDQPVAQALIKVQFVEVTHTDDFAMGADITYEDVEANGDSSVVSSLLGASNITQGGTVAILDGDLQVTLKALATATKMEVLSKPSIMTRSNEEATITVGQEVPFIRNSQITDAGGTINTIEYEDIGIILTVTPKISSDGMVEMNVAPEISTLTGETVTIQEGVEAPTFAKRSAQTTVVVPTGKTVVIGGLMDSQEVEAETKVPILGDIPLLGKLFTTTIKDKTKTELLIFLTPQVVRSANEAKRLAKSETRSAKYVKEMLDREHSEKRNSGNVR